jgi:hypothetical protein
MPHTAPPSGARAHRFDALLCALVSLAAFLCAHPYVEMGLSDDFSYAKTAWVFAATGHFVYNGWATAMLGWQIPYAAPFVKVFGANFLALRLSVTALMFLTVLVLHAVLRRSGLNRGWSAFGALLVGLCPLTMALTATFMTDIGGMLVIAFAIYCALRTVQAATDRATLLWLALGFLTGAVGGTSRQIAWMCALVMMPSAAWLVRRRRGVVAVTVVGWVVSAAVMFWCLHWFAHQPFNVPEPLIQGRVGLGRLRSVFDQFTASAMCVVFLLTPAFAAGLAAARRLRWRTIALTALGGVLFALVVHLPLHHDMMSGWMPWQRDFLARMDLWSTQDMWSYGTWPAALTTRGRIVISLAVCIIVALFVVSVWRSRKENVSPSRVLSWRDLLVLLVPFAATYVALLAPRAAWSYLLDRYLLPLMMLAAIALLRLAQERLSARVHAPAWIVLGVFTLYGIAGVHDWVAGFRARTVAVARLREAGIPDDKIRAGFELDGLTQIDKTGAVVDPRVHFPAGFDTHPHRPAGERAECEHIYHPYTPALEPEWVLAYDREPCLTPSRFGEIDYTAWLPPFHRRQLILHFDPTRAEPGS